MYEFTHGIDHIGKDGIAPILKVGKGVCEQDFIERDLSAIQGIFIRHRGLDKGVKWQDLNIELLGKKFPNLRYLCIEFGDQCDVTPSRPKRAGGMPSCSRRAASYCSRVGMKIQPNRATPPLPMSASSKPPFRCSTWKWPSSTPSMWGWMGWWCITRSADPSRKGRVHTISRSKKLLKKLSMEVDRLLVAVDGGGRVGKPLSNVKVERKREDGRTSSHAMQMAIDLV